MSAHSGHPESENWANRMGGGASIVVINRVVSGIEHMEGAIGLLTPISGIYL